MTGKFTSGYSVRHILKDFVRIALDDYGAGSVHMVETDYGWRLFEDGKIAGNVYYTLDSLIIEYNYYG